MYDFLCEAGETPEGLITPGYEEVIRDIVDIEDEFNEPGSLVKYPLTQLFDLAHTLQIVNEPYESGYHIFSVSFEENRIGAGRSNPIVGYSVRMHTQVKRFEDYVDRFGVTITELSLLNHGHELHVAAVCQVAHLCWLEFVCIYSEADFPAGVSLEDDLKGAFIEHAQNHGWQILN